MVVEVGGGLREYEIDGVGVLDGYALEAMADGVRGQPLLPWPNRLADGRYSWDGEPLQLPIDEVARHNASHGLTRWANWRVVEESPTRTVMEYLLHPRPGYPFTLALSIAYMLTEAGLEVTTTAENRGTRALPYGIGFHPYLTAGSGLIDSARLRLPARRRLAVDERLVPTGVQHEVNGSEYDFRAQRELGGQVIDTCFTDLERDPDGLARVQLRGAHTVTLWLDSSFGYLQVFTGETLAPEARRRGLAVEPMSCPPDAFNSRVDVVRLEPEAQHTSTWGLAASIP